MDNYYLTKERFDELRRELDSLKGQKRLEIADQLKRAKEYGDLSENAEYAQAREEQSQIEARIFELEELLKTAVIIKRSAGSETVEIGSQVTIKKDGAVLTYGIVGSNESKPEEGNISNESPIGGALLGKKVGESVKVKTPSGEVTYQITKIE